MLTIMNKEKLIGNSFISNGKEWRITNVKETNEYYYISIIHTPSPGSGITGYLKFELDRDRRNDEWYGMVIMDAHNNSVDWNILFAKNIRTKDSMLLELQLIMNKFTK
jgi:hypothetical protein